MSSLKKKTLKEFISIHVHKAGGTTLGFIMQDMFGDKFFWDKSEDTVNLHGRVMSYSMDHVSKHDVIHGHIHVDKYAMLNRPYITWLRHPVSRFESEYSIIRQKRITGRSSPFHRQIISEKLSFLDYCKVLNNVYTRYLGDKKVEDFAFIGITEMYEESLFVFSQVVGIKLPPYFRRNTRILRRQWFREGDRDEKRECAKLNQRDIEYYYQARKRLIHEFKSCLSLYEPGECSPKRK